MFKASLTIGDFDVILSTQDKKLYELAHKRIYLKKEAKQNKQLLIRFVGDEKVDNIIKKPVAENAVYIEKIKTDNFKDEWHIKVFNQFCVVIKQQENETIVFYSNKAIYSYLLDDVLQAAIANVIEQQNGFILHGAALVKDDKAIALIGPSGSGKSTSAYNLMRGGYACYADDAVIVTSKDNALWVWPFSKEISLRPLSYNLLKQQGIEFKNYRKDGRKYYFRQNTPKKIVGIKLHAISLLSVAGEKKTTHTELTLKNFKQGVLSDTKFFSFINREQHAKYLKQICLNVRHFYASKMGSDLNAQIHSVDKLLNIQCANIPKSDLKYISRDEKLSWIKSAWIDNDNAEIDKIIPLLADSDLKVYENLLAFFQNNANAQIVLINEPHEDTNNFPDWLNSEQWHQGCKKLAQTISSEIIKEYATGWLISAPLLMPFLNQYIEKELRPLLMESWQQAKIGLGNIIQISTNYAQCNNIENFQNNIFNHDDIVICVNKKQLLDQQYIVLLENFIKNKNHRIFLKPEYTALKKIPESLVRCALKHNQYALALGYAK